MAIVHDDAGRRRFLSQAVMGFGMLFGLGTLGFRFMQFLLPTRTDKQPETVLIGAETRIPLGDAVPMDLGGAQDTRAQNAGWRGGVFPALHGSGVPGLLEQRT